MSTEAIEAVPRRRWRIAWLLGLGVLVNYFDRVNLSVSQSGLHDSFGINDVTFGYLAAAYSVTYGLLQLPIGVILDRLGIQLLGRMSTFLWSVASFAGAISPGLGSLFAARLLLGVGEAPTFPANAKAIGLWFPRGERSFPTSINDSAAKFASAIGVPLLGMLLLRVGWRWSFAATGMVSLAYFGLFTLVYRDPKDDPLLSEEERQHIARDVVAGEAEEKPMRFLYLVRQRKMVGLFLGFGAYNYTFYLLLNWLPKYFATQLHVDLLHSFLFTGLPWLVATATDLLIGGLLVDWLIHSGWDANAVRKTVLVGGMACGLGILGAAQVHSAVWAVVWVSISIGGLSAAAPVGWSVPSLIAPKSSVGTVGGIANFASQLSAFFAPIVTGYIVQSLHSFGWAFAVSAAYILVGIFGYVVLLGKIEPMKAESV